MIGKLALANRVAVVTGGEQVVGRAIAVTLARAGARTVLVTHFPCSRNARSARSTAEIATSFVECGANITSESGIEVLKAFLEAGGYDVDILVNGMSHVGHAGVASSIADADWLDAFNMNLLTPYRLTRLLGSKMRARQGGSIVNVFGGSGFAANATRVPLAATSASLWTVTQALSSEFAPFVRVNAVCAGARFDNGAMGDLSPSPLGTEGRPQDLAEAVLYLVDDTASTTTGTMLTVGRNTP